MADVLLVETATCYVGSANPEASKHLQIQNLVLPTLEYTTVEHEAGGAAMGVNWNMNRVKALQPKFKLIGFDDDSYRAAGVGSNKIDQFTFRGLIRRKSDGKGLELVAKFRGSMGTLTPDEYGASKEFGHDHMLSDVTFYRLLIGGKEWFEIDFFRTKRIRFGVDELAQARNYLGLS